MAARADSFVLEASESLRVPGAARQRPTRIRTFRHSGSALRIVFVDVPGPLCSASIVVPTVCNSHKGLPHTLEHLIFCGSKSIPHRGFLDNLAIRCLSTGTNAYTSEDHTAYEITTAGAEGLVQVLPVFLDHVLHPTLRQRQFMTEVFHVDGEGRNQGVVYCEMASREHTEADLLDLALRRSICRADQTTSASDPSSSSDQLPTYAFECGGLTPYIAKLTNDEIISYHKSFYRLDRLTIIVCGQVDPSTLFEKLSSFPNLLQPVSNDHDATPLPTQSFPPILDKLDTLQTTRVPFPSSETDIGSIGYAYHGPPSEDFETLVALDVLFRYMHETSASPLAQAFVERVDPYVSQIDVEIKGFVQTMLVFVFSGVPFFDEEENEEDDEKDEEDDEDEDDDDDSDNDDEENDEDIEARRDLFEPGVFFKLFREVIKQFVHDGFTVPGGISVSLRRHRRKILEALEEDPHETLTSYLVPDITRHYLAATSTLSDTIAQGGQPRIGTRTRIFEILDQLEKKPDAFWQSLARKWILDVPVCEVMMVPSKGLADEMQFKEQQDIEDRRAKLGPDGLAHLKTELELALKENEIHITEELQRQFPPVPDASRAPLLRASTQTMYFDADASYEKQSLTSYLVVRTETAFIHTRLGFDLGRLSPTLRPYLVLFQELLFQTSLVFPASSGDRKTIRMDYRDVSQYASEIFISHESATGFGNDRFSASWLSDVFMLSATSERGDWERSHRFLVQVLLFSEFEKDRIITITKNLLSGLKEVKRDGGWMTPAVATRMCSRSFAQMSDGAHKYHHDDKWSSYRANSLAETADREHNDGAISVFVQETFLRNVLRQCTNGQANDVLQKLNLLRMAILDAKPTTSPGFVRLAVPMDFAVSGNVVVDNESKKFNEELAHDWLGIWSSELAKYRSRRSPKGKKRDAHPVDLDAKSVAENALANRAFPFARTPYQISHLDPKLGNGLVVPITGVTASFLSQFVPCDVLSSPDPHPDFFPMLLLAEVLSRTEGPLYTAVRGAGHAYGASLNLYLWHGQLSYDVNDASEPHKALMSFYDIIDQLCTPTGLSTLCSDFDLETARAVVAYRWVSECGTADGVIATALRSVLRGVASLDAHRKMVEHVYAVTRLDLQRVVDKYLVQMMDPSKRATVVIVPGGGGASKNNDDYDIDSQDKVAVRLVHAMRSDDDDETDGCDAIDVDRTRRVSLKVVRIEDLQVSQKHKK